MPAGSAPPGYLARSVLDGASTALRSQRHWTVCPMTTNEGKSSLNRVAYAQDDEHVILRDSKNHSGESIWQ